MRRIFAFLETLVADDDPRVREVAMFAIGEDIKGNFLEEKARPYMGPLMTEVMRLLDRYYMSRPPRAEPEL